MWATYILLYIWVSVDDVGLGYTSVGVEGKEDIHTSLITITPLRKPPAYISPLLSSPYPSAFPSLDPAPGSLISKG